MEVEDIDTDGDANGDYYKERNGDINTNQVITVMMYLHL